MFTCQERGRGALGVAGLTHTCGRAVPGEGCPSDSAFSGSSAPRDRQQKESQPGMQPLSNATCVSVNVGFVPPQSLTRVDYLCLEQKARTSQILRASNQVLQRRGNIFPFVDRNCNQNNCCNCTRKRRLIPLIFLQTCWRFRGRARDITRAEMSRKRRAKTRVRGGSAVEERASVSQTKRERGRERGSSVGELSLLASVQVQVEFCPKAKSFLGFV